VVSGKNPENYFLRGGLPEKKFLRGGLPEFPGNL